MGETQKTALTKAHEGNREEYFHIETALRGIGNISKKKP